MSGGHHMLGDGHPRPCCPLRALPASTDTLRELGCWCSCPAKLHTDLLSADRLCVSGCGWPCSGMLLCQGTCWKARIPESLTAGPCRGQLTLLGGTWHGLGLGKSWEGCLAVLSHRGRGRPGTPARSLKSEALGRLPPPAAALAAPPGHFLQRPRQRWAPGRARGATLL